MRQRSGGLWLIIAVLVLAGCGSASPWWQQTGASSCGTPALAPVADRVLPLSNCAGDFFATAQKVTVHVGRHPVRSIAAS